MAKGDKWVPILAHDLCWIGGNLCVIQKGSTFIPESMEPIDTPFKIICTVQKPGLGGNTLERGVDILHAIRTEYAMRRQNNDA